VIINPLSDADGVNLQQGTGRQFGHSEAGSSRSSGLVKKLTVSDGQMNKMRTTNKSKQQ